MKSSVILEAEVSNFFTEIGAFTVAGDGESLANLCVMPLAIYLPGELRVFRKPRELARYVTTYSEYLASRKIVKSIPQTVEVLDATDQRAMVQVQWDFFSNCTDISHQSTTKYVLRRGPSRFGLLVELVDYTVIAFPDFVEQTFFSVQTIPLTT